MSAYVEDAAECSEEDDAEIDDDGSAGSMADFIDDEEIDEDETAACLDRVPCPARQA